ncbi:MAG: WYL domain-containing protein [Candidatus Cryptobacteroides sp.]
MIDILSTPRSLKEISDLWVHSNFNASKRKRLSRSTFYYWKDFLKNTFGIEIVSSLHDGTHKFSIAPSCLEDGITGWLLNTASVENMLLSNIAIRDRILLEDIPSSRDVLKTVLEAIKQNHLISFDYEDYWEDPINVTIQPYFVKLDRQHWKVIGPLADGKLEGIRSYALDADRMKNLKVLATKFQYPADFSPVDFMAESIGTATFPTKAAKPKDVIILAWEKVNLYLKHTPLHGSQRILHDCPEDGYTIFSYRLHTTDDFYQEVCRFGNYMEVLYPNDVREEMMKIIRGMGEEYAGESRKTCKKRVPSVRELKSLLNGKGY